MLCITFIKAYNVLAFIVYENTKMLLADQACQS
jgi:hypothetical protein